MIVDEDVQHLRRFHDRLGESDIRIRRADVAGGVVMGEDDRGGLFPQGAFQDLPRVHHGLIDDPLLDRKSVV